MLELKRYACITCGAPLKEQDGKFVCANCKNEFHLEEKISEEEVVSLNRATTDRNLLRFDDAFEEYDLLLKKYPKNEMANWGAFLSFYGIVYEQDLDGKYIPTCHRFSEKPVESSKYYYLFNDEHKRRAEEIEKLRIAIAEKAKRIPPYDVFICYKATEERFGRPYPTKEASWARDVYEMLTHELKLRVFFAEKSLGDSNEEYEPHIYSALNSAKLMFVLTTGIENVNAVWVKNEWKRYSKYIQEGQKKTIRVVYDNIEPYDLPLELQKTQAINHNEMDWGAKVKKAAQAIFIDPLEEEKKKRETEEKARKAREEAEAREHAREEELQKMRETMEALKKQANAPKPAPAPTTTVTAPVRRGEPADKYCVKCGAGNVKSAKFCAECAHNVFTPEFKQYCLECGTETELLKKFCPNCAKNRFAYDKDAYEKEIGRRKLASFEIGNGVLRRYKGDDKKVTIPDSVKGINYYAFKGCRDLTSIIIPDSVTSIDNDAFMDCNSLLGIAVGEKNTAYRSIDGNLYSKDGKTILRYAAGRKDTSFTVPDSVTSIGSRAFNGCASLMSITIPAAVTSIGEDAFKGCDNLAKVKCPAIACKHLPKKNLQAITVTGGSLEEKALDGCSNLTSVTLLEGVTSIGDSAFSICSGLTGITIPASVTNIDMGAFSGCSSLTSITIPASVTTIGERVFLSCENLTSIAVDEKNAEYKSIDGNLYSKDGKTFVQYAAGKKDTSFTLPDSVMSIGAWAFSHCESLASITIPDSVTSIGNSAFEGCSSLASITIPDGVTSIADGTFYACRSLTNMVIPDGVTSIDNGAFGDCNSLTNIVLGANVTSIGGAAFLGCSSLTSINIPNGVTSIGFNAFCRCANLTNVNIPDSVESIGYSAFGSCTSLTSITIPDGVKDIKTQTFYGCSRLTNLTIPNSVTNIAEDAFSGCYNLRVAECCMSAYRYLPKSLDTIRITGGYIWESAFEGYENLTTVIIRDGVTNIGKWAFRDCKRLTSIIIPDSVTKIDKSAFSKCSAIKYITCPVLACAYVAKGSLQMITITGGVGNGAKIADDTFRGYLNLESVIIANGVTSIGDHAFYGCRSLTSITIPDSVTSIDNGAFQNCTNLTNITIPDSVTSIDMCAFLGCSSLTSVTIPDSVTHISGGAFNGCTGLTSVTIPDGVTSIGERAFYGCHSLRSVTIGNGVTSIGAWAFSHCESLASITIPDSVTSIGNSAFEGCSSLTSVIIPNSVTSIGFEAFKGCGNLTVYAYAEKKPKGWHEKRGFLGIGITESWNPDKRPVVWGYKGK